MSVDVDGVAVLSDLRPKGITGPHVDLRAHLGDQRKVPAHIQPSAHVHGEGLNGGPGSGQRPGLVGSLLYFYLLIFCEQT